MKIKKDTRIYLSELGAKGFLYPSESFVTLPEEVEVERLPLIFDKSSKLIPVRVTGNLGKEELSMKLSTVFWVSEK
jgi:hypothetical protein